MAELIRQTAEFPFRYSGLGLDERGSETKGSIHFGSLDGWKFVSLYEPDISIYLDDQRLRLERVKFRIKKILA